MGISASGWTTNWRPNAASAAVLVSIASPVAFYGGGSLVASSDYDSPWYKTMAVDRCLYCGRKPAEKDPICRGCGAVLP